MGGRVTKSLRTNWSLVRRAAAGDSRALSNFVQQYMPVLRLHVRRLVRANQAECDDLLQDFLQHRLLSRDFLRRADPEKGRFRGLLITALNHYLIDSRRRQRGPIPVSIDDVSIPNPPAPVTSDSFDVTWARHLIRLALDRARQDCFAAEQSSYWTLFEWRLLKPAIEGCAPVPYADCMARLGFTTVAEACNALVTVQRRIRRALRVCVAEYAAPEEIEQEIADLHGVLTELGGTSGLADQIKEDNR
jgi:DNA-directed RNA polymerase specialized sigma24 family protein